MLLKILSEQGKAVILSSHILTELAEICTDVVIIEQGRLLQSGSLKDLAQTKKEHTTVLIRSLGEPESLFKDVLQMPHVSDARVMNNLVAVDLVGSDEHCFELLQTLMHRGHKVVEFHQEKTKLEDIFMTITEGRVQ